MNEAAAIEMFEVVDMLTAERERLRVRETRPDSPLGHYDPDAATEIEEMRVNIRFLEHELRVRAASA